MAQKQLDGVRMYGLLPHLITHHLTKNTCFFKLEMKFIIYQQLPLIYITMLSKNKVSIHQLLTPFLSVCFDFQCLYLDLATPICKMILT